MFDSTKSKRDAGEAGLAENRSADNNLLELLKEIRDEQKEATKRKTQRLKYAAEAGTYNKKNHRDKKCRRRHRDEGPAKTTRGHRPGNRSETDSGSSEGSSSAGDGSGSQSTKS